MAPKKSSNAQATALGGVPAGSNLRSVGRTTADAKQPPANASQSANAGGKPIRKTFVFGTGDVGFECGDDACVSRVTPGLQADKHGIQIGWKLMEIGDKKIKGLGDNEHTRYAKRIKERLRVTGTYRGKYNVTFMFPGPMIDEAKIEEEATALSKLDALTQEQRDKNLEVLDEMNSSEKVVLLQRPKACQALLKSGYDELTVLFGERSSYTIQNCHAVMNRLSVGEALGDIEDFDIEYRDAAGDTALHWAATPSSAGPLLEKAVKHSPHLLEKPNKNGELPLESMLRRAKEAKDRTAILNLFRNAAPNALEYKCADGQPLGLKLEEEERQLLNPPLVAWPAVQDVLMTQDLKSFQSGYAGLSAKVCASRQDIVPDDNFAVWDCLLNDHCFGVHKSRERLEVVWAAVERLLTWSSDEELDFECDLTQGGSVVPNTALKGIARGLFKATMGPQDALFDPREPYRKRMVAHVVQLQNKTAKRLAEVLQKLQQENPEAALAVANEIPFNALHGLADTGASSRGAPERLRLDSKLSKAVENVAPISTPEWVLSQQIDMDMINTLKTAGCIEKARDLVELVNSRSKALSMERLRFASLHTAWVWAKSGRQLSTVSAKIKEHLGLGAGEITFPCKGSGEFTWLSFRARSEPKGLPRLLEKTAEAAEEEVAVGEAAKVLALQPDAQSTPEAAKGEQLALVELLTPGCYVCDIVGAEASVGSFQELLAVYRKLCSLTIEEHCFQVVRTKSGFSKDALEAAGGYRDLKLWVMVDCDGTSTVAELQIHIHSVLEQKKFMHLSYECFRGSYDHPHLADKWQVPPEPEPEPFDPPKRGCCAALCCAASGKGKAKVAPES